MITKTLKEWMTKYGAWWDDWLCYPHNGLSEEDVYTIREQLKNNFVVKPGETLMFYNKPEMLSSTAEKLRRNYSTYKGWLSMKFFFLLIKEYGGDKAQEFSKPIDEMAMEPELKALLKDFKSATLEELFNTAYEFEFRKLNWFNTIRRFMLTYKSLHFDERKKKKKSRVKPAEGKEEVGRKGIRISSFYRKKAKPKLRLNSVYMTGNYNLN